MATNGTTNTNTSGEESVAFDFKKKQPSDCISDKNFAEFARRLIGVITSNELGSVVFSPEEPQNTKKLWVETSPAGGNIGTIKRFDAATAEWVDDHTELLDSEDIKSFSETRVMGSDDETIVYNHNFGTVKYGYGIIYTSAPLGTARWFQVNKDVSTLELKFLGASGVSVEVTIIEIII